MKEHAPASDILREADKTNSRRYIELTVRCAEAARSRVIEYLKGTVTTELPNGDTMMKLTVVENEQLLIGTPYMLC